MSDETPCAEEALAQLAAHEEEMDKLFAEMGLPPLGENMDEAAAQKAYEAALPPIVRAAFIDAPEARHAALRELVAERADLNATDGFGTKASFFLFQKCDVAGLLILIEAGADLSDYQFGLAHLAVLRSDPVGACDLAAKDARGRSPFLLACRLGQAKMVARIFATDPEACLSDRDGDHSGALSSALASSDTETIEFLLDHGFEIDQPNRFGATPLYHAVEMNNLSVAETLLARGASLDVRYNLTTSMAQKQSAVMSKMTALTTKLMPSDTEDTIQTLYDSAYTPEMVKLLISYGANPALFRQEVFAAAIGADQLPERAVSHDDFMQSYAPFYGKANPEKVDIPLWHEQIRTNRSGYAAKRDLIGEDPDLDRPVWSFDRFGRTGTILPDGRLVLIAGEHEDGYDPDFHIYNDVTVMHPEGGMDHYIYPLDVFPPTDFHTATLVNDAIWIIGALGYQGQRQHGETQVLRLDLGDFSVHRVQTTGRKPGWINRHSALLDGHHIVVTGGRVEPGFTELDGSYVLNLETLVWARMN